MDLNVKKIYDFLREKFPEAKCELNRRSNYELLVAVILSAQCTDKRVNLITKDLF
jgi:endonuclease-3